MHYFLYLVQLSRERCGLQCLVSLLEDVLVGGGLIIDLPAGRRQDLKKKIINCGTTEGRVMEIQVCLLPEFGATCLGVGTAGHSSPLAVHLQVT